MLCRRLIIDKDMRLGLCEFIAEPKRNKITFPLARIIVTPLPCSVGHCPRPPRGRLLAPLEPRDEPQLQPRRGRPRLSLQRPLTQHLGLCQVRLRVEPRGGIFRNRREDMIGP